MMHRFSYNFISLFASTFFLFTGYGLFLSSAGIRLTEMGVSSVLIGALNTCFFVGASLSSVVAHRIVSRVGHIRSFTVFGAVFAIAALAHTMSDSLTWWFILRTLLGFCYFSILMVVESWFTERSALEIRAKVLGIYNSVYYAAVTVGILLLNMGLSSANIFSLSAILVMVAMLPVTLTRIPSPEIPPQERISFPKVFAMTPLAIVGSFTAGILVNGLFTMASVFLLLQQYTVQEVSLYLSIAMIGGFVAQAPIAYLSNKLGRRTTILLCAVLSLVTATISLLAMYALPAWHLIQYGVAFLFGVSLFTLYALSLARANDVLPNHMNTVEVSRSLLFSYGVGSLVSPLMIGLILQFMPTYGFYSIYWIASLVLAVMSISQKPVPEALRSVHVNMAGSTSSLMNELDPRNKQDCVPFDSDVAQEYLHILAKQPDYIVQHSEEQVIEEILDHVVEHKGNKPSSE